MKKTTKLSLMLISFLVCSIFSNVSAQETTGTTQQTNFGIRAAGMQIGWYNPSMDYWNDTYFKNNNWDNDFKGSMFYGAYFELNIINHLSARTGFSYWKETVKSGEMQIGGLTGNEKLELSLTSIPIDIIYQLDFLAFGKFKPYAGLGGSFLFVQNKFTRTLPGLPDEEIKEQGQDFTGHFILGVERQIIAHFSAGVEFNYVFGKYQQEVEKLNGDILKEDVSVSGPKIGLKLAYHF
jgi:Outer membrane protein beta-barrel domain